MAATAAPDIHCERQFPLLIVSDIPAAIEFYTQKLGFAAGFVWGDPPEMAGMNFGSVSIHLYKGEPNGNAVYFVVEDADELNAFHQANGVEVVSGLADQLYELRDYAVKDPWGNRLSFGHYIQLSVPPLPVQRVDVPVRMEKRLAALLADLAAYKGMSIGSCLEETLLHTFEVVGKDEGVASPHNRKTHDYIQKLKKKHGIDYDVHASYRFVE